MNSRKWGKKIAVFYSYRSHRRGNLDIACVGYNAQKGFQEDPKGITLLSPNSNFWRIWVLVNVSDVILKHLWLSMRCLKSSIIVGSFWKNWDAFNFVVFHCSRDGLELYVEEATTFPHTMSTLNKFSILGLRSNSTRLYFKLRQYYKVCKNVRRDLRET